MLMSKGGHELTTMKPSKLPFLRYLKSNCKIIVEKMLNNTIWPAIPPELHPIDFS